MPTVVRTLDHVTELLDNDVVEVARVDLEPGEMLPVHPEGRRVVYTLSDFTLRYYQYGSDTYEAKQAGDVYWHGTGTHAVQNVGRTRASYLCVHLKEHAPRLHPAGVEGPGLKEAGGDHVRLLYENAQVRVVEVTLEPGGGLPDHTEPDRIVYALGDSLLHYAFGTGAIHEKAFTRGEVRWHAASRVSVKNVGRSTSRFLVVAVK